MPTAILYTHDLIPGREHLIPWRTLIEFAAVLNENGYNATILSGVSSSQNEEWAFGGVTIRYAPKPSPQLMQIINGESPDFIIWPVTWFVNKRSFAVLSQIKAKRMVYFPGGLYKLNYFFRALKYVDFRSLLPYLVESVYPKKLTVSNLKKNGIDHAICFTQLTLDRLIQAGWDKAKGSAIYPGFDALPEQADELIYNRYFADRPKKYFLFMGSPSPIRGSGFLIDAINHISSSSADIAFVFLIRSDKGVSDVQFNKKLKTLNGKERCIVINEKLSRNQLLPFIKNAHSVILPFLIIPSEVPVTFYEVLNIGKPVITLDNGGTTDHLKDFLYIAKGNPKDLSEQIEYCFNDRNNYTNKVQLISKHFANKYTWDTFATHIIELIKRQ